MGDEGVYYQVKEGFVHRKVAGNDVLISVGANIVNFNGYIVLNSTASFLWDIMKQPYTICQLVQALIAEFDVSEQNAYDDVREFIQMLQSNSMLKESTYENN